ncbi:tctex1 domain protein 2-like [Tropilaelaps mercedesae]|uniref:Tctex1 domain protein 2-like n=1 Tax=Tropilaelaps mercedesae TaxID=418985 RepID=A0A1V9XWS9_9ACAR|nr:tctex1 domain protein 2-like [Tropilaelaps mercedesae]
MRMTKMPVEAPTVSKFNLRPSLELRFKPDEAKQVMKEIVNPLLDSVERYDAERVSKLTRKISEKVVEKLKELSERAKEDEALRPTTAASNRSLSDAATGGRYKIICHTVIVENRGAGIRVSYGQQWDVDSDGATSHFYASSCLQCTCTVLALFYY